MCSIYHVVSPYKGGMVVEVWPESDGIGECIGKLVHIQYRSILLLCGDMIYAGGYQFGENGNPRVHMCIYKNLGLPRDRHTINCYVSPTGQSLSLTHHNMEAGINSLMEEREMEVTVTIPPR
jgi:hypothetical protein